MDTKKGCVHLAMNRIENYILFRAVENVPSLSQMSECYKAHA